LMSRKKHKIFRQRKAMPASHFSDRRFISR